MFARASWETGCWIATLARATVVSGVTDRYATMARTN